MTPIHEAARIFLQGLLDDLDDGVVEVVRLEADGHDRRATIAWRPASGAAPPQIAADGGAGAAVEPGHCPTCKQPAEVIPEENGGGLFCPKCDSSW
jgi:hypothetical protein